MNKIYKTFHFSTRLKSLTLSAFALVAFSLTPALADRQFTDQLNRSVTVPDKVERVVVLQHQTLDILVELDADKKIVGVLDRWPKLIPGLDTYAPELDKLPKVGDLTSVNIEEVVGLNPDVVFVTNYAPQAMIDQITKVGIPVVAISLSKGEGIEAPKLNPTFADDDAAYSEGLREGIKLIGAIVDRDKQADELIQYAFDKRKIVEDRVANIADKDRVRLYMANPDLHTYGSGKYTGVIMKRSGGTNVAEGIKGAAQVSIEQVVLWDPQVIFVQDRYASVADDIRNNPQWKEISAVKNNKIYITPEYVKPWGYPLPEALALGELWMAKKLYPEKFADIDINEVVQEYYQKFYRHSYDGEN
ncbi:ABC transporter substrate-binding protein [Bartonella sp. HY761]|uniref:ABC transporter substrate-binding protein n=1 Tax=Bartonella sp. HY761 TaxID=2979330 RepID=UPI0022022221|nr:ABC transporter substrate-binding protein [Bartonella sp. HY761]UXN05671.1 ABC transporter substrate-binding protein [Bartonella sp. HY761]